jgi:hypothetical protein
VLPVSQQFSEPSDAVSRAGYKTAAAELHRRETLGIVGDLLTGPRKTFTCGFSPSRSLPGWRGPVLSGTGKHRPTTPGCPEYVPKFGMLG